MGGGTVFFSDFSQPWRAQFNTDLSLQPQGAYHARDGWRCPVSCSAFLGGAPQPVA